MDSNKGIIITGGEFHADQVAVGDNAKAIKNQSIYHLSDEEKLALTNAPLTEEHKQLAKMMIERFNIAEIISFCFGLGIDYEEFSSKGKTNKIIELIRYVVRHDMLEKFKAVGKADRPDIDWDKIIPSIDNDS